MIPAPRPADQPHRFEALDSLRGVCASMIVLLHFTTNGHISQSVFIDHAFLFVDFFFVLSGFVIAASYGDRIAAGFPIRKFMGLRLGRIYPLHAAVLLAFLAFEILFAVALSGSADRVPFTNNFSLDKLLAEVFLVQTFTGPDGTPWNGPSWSIAVEMWTYLVFAIAFRWINRWIVPAIFLLAVGCCYWLTFTNRYINVFHDGAFARCLYGFGMGVVAQRVFVKVGGPLRLPVAVATLIELAAIVFTVVMVIVSGPSPLSLAMPLVFFAVVLVFAQQAGGISRILLLRPFLIGGTLSYSIYMVHGFLEYRVVNVFLLLEKLLHHRVELVTQTQGHNHIGGSPLFGDIMSITMLALTIAVAAITYRFIEKPGQRWSRRRILGARPQPAAFVAEREVTTF